MTIRTSEKTVIFERPFILSGFDQLLQAGAYRVQTDEELMEGISFPAYRRVATLLHIETVPGVSQTLTVDPKDSRRGPEAGPSYVWGPNPIISLTVRGFG